MHIINPYRYAGGGGGGGDIPFVEAIEPTVGGISQTTITATAPSGITSGEALLLIVGGEAAIYTTPADWTLGNQYSASGASYCVFYKVADGTETDVTITADAGNEMYAWYVRVSGASATPLDVIGADEGGFGTVGIISEVTTTVDNCLAFYVLGADGGDCSPFSVAGTGWTESGDLANGTGNGAGGCWGTKEQATAGLTGDATVTASVSDGLVFVQFAIAPA